MLDCGSTPPNGTIVSFPVVSDISNSKKKYRYNAYTNLRMTYKPNHLIKPVEQRDYLAMTSTEQELIIEIARKPGLTMMHVWSRIEVGMFWLENWCILAWRSHPDRVLIARSRAAETDIPDTAATLIDNDSMPLVFIQGSKYWSRVYSTSIPVLIEFYWDIHLTYTWFRCRGRCTATSHFEALRFQGCWTFPVLKRAFCESLGTWIREWRMLRAWD